MATLTVNGKKVTVDDAFLSLPKEAQEATVNEIAASMGGSGPPAGARPGSREYAQWAASEARAGRELPRVSGPESIAPRQSPNLLDSSLATINGLTGSVPFLQEASDGLLAVGQTVGNVLTNSPGSVSSNYDAIRRRRDAVAERAPIANVLGEVAGTIGTLGVAGSTKAGAEALGLTGPMWKQAVNSAGSSALYTGASGVADGQNGMQTLTDMGVSGATGWLTPWLTEGVKKGGQAVYDRTVRPVMTALNPENAAANTVGRAVTADRASGDVMGATEQAAAMRAGAPVMNADRFGTATRRLARVAVNSSPEADAALTNAVQDRFYTQGARAKGFVQQLMGGATDDLALRDRLDAAMTSTNNVNYEKARNSPNARAIWTPPIKELMQSDSFIQAINAAESRGTDRAAAQGLKAVRNPFEFRPDGTVTLRTNADGTRALPSLDFWNQVKINLDGMIGNAKRAGDNTLVGDLMGLKRKLVSSLDAAVPEYKTARGVAAAFFDADDAVDAGRKAVASVRNTPEIRAAVAKMSQTEKDAFSVGFASEIIDAIDATGDRVNVINKMFNSPQARERIEIALGQQKARELEAFVRAEQILDQLRNAVSGNSTTVKQLMAAGVINAGAGAAGYTASGGDWTSGLTVAIAVAAARRGASMIGRRIDERVMQSVAKMLTSQKPADVQRAIQNAAMSKQHMDALNAIMTGLRVAGTGTAVTALNGSGG